MVKQILCDTDFFIAFLIAEDTNHQVAVELANQYSDHDFLYTNLTKYELVTVLSRKLEQKLAVQALEIFEDLFVTQIEFNRTFELDILNFYKQSEHKNQSFFDIACLVQAKHFGIKIASFDKFYPKNLLIS